MCRPSDTECAVRSYPSLTRLACADRRIFDRKFDETHTEWSEFFWREGGGQHEEMCHAFEMRVDRRREGKECRKSREVRA